MLPEDVRSALCRLLCEDLTVVAVPVGLAVVTEFLLPDGDPLNFYVRTTADGLVLEDDGDFVATAIASGLPLDVGARGQLFEGILREEGAYLDRDTCQIKTHPVEPGAFGRTALRFISALIRARDLYLLTAETVASTFVEDVRNEVAMKLGDQFHVEEEEDGDNPADVVLKDPRTGLRAALIYAANSNEKLLSALVRHQDRRPGEAPVIAMVERLAGGALSSRRVEMAQNRGLLMPVFRDDRESALDFVRSHAKQPSAA